MKFIKSAQRMGFSLDEIHHLLRLDEGMQCDAAAELAAQHLNDVRTRLQNLHRIEVTLANLLDQCRKGGKKVTCPLILALHTDEVETP
ncbi:Hg(II)-responsive transcriptional regulator [Acidihalobacter prosperus]|uniref:Hg(II)-responsive transcriptional regulator n=1 Tax=Acidihalobacter prosperus TaxID=160660 RepID=A0A1A6BZY6_9GAMM|nr:Hg(II)-responsive transcriptional regulator [Acidihalobacter prosperus]